MKILVIGSGGREHAICWKIASEVKSATLYALPGNAGIGEIANLVNIPLDNLQDIASFAKKEKIDFTIVGPELPLVSGIVDIFKKKKLKIFGPSQKASNLEASKVWAKEFMAENNVPTGRFSVSDDFINAKKIVEKSKFPVVIKFDGLAAGKGVSVVREYKEAVSFLEDIFEKRIFSSKNNRVVIEEFLAGEELSYLVITEGENFIPLTPARDYKRIYDGDKGPNTGGMGCYSPVPMCSQELEKLIEKKIVIPTIKGLQKRGIDYCGVIYFGLMITDRGPEVLEYNVRFGDPETEVILPRMASNLIDVLQAAVEGESKRETIVWKQEAAVDVVIASGGYPGSYKTEVPITGLDLIPPDVTIFHAGTKKKNDTFVTCGGRVLNVVGIGKSLKEARAKAYERVSTIFFRGMYFRKDIAVLDEQD
ncbi:MAG: phosphoribosylamine--glycine ligase [Candidatus Omnitrophica bacterium]|nr:phosphoribosylamine--glycine ligase [Candidatus Omnitrophota bacterium]